MKTYPLRKFVHRVLIVRLGIATFVIAACVGLISYTVQSAQIGREAVGLGRRGISALQEKVRFETERQVEKSGALIEGKKIDPVNVLREVLGKGTPPAVYRAGRFVSRQVYDRPFCHGGREVVRSKPALCLSGCRTG